MSTKRLITIVVLGLILVTLAGTPVGAQFISMLNNGASLSLNPPSRSVQVGDIFTLDIVVDTGTGCFDTADAYINFDPLYLEVVDESGDLATAIEWNIDIFPSPIFNTADNATGRIDFSATRFAGSLTGTFTVATIRFRAMSIGVTDVVFVRDGARMSDLYCSGEPLSVTLENSTVTISDGPEADLTIVKDASPPDGTDFVFAGDLGTFTLDDAVPDDGDTVSDTITFTNLLHGTFTITEAVPAGWQLTNIVCQDPDSGTTTSGNSATIDLDAGEHITCTFTNTGPPAADLVITKSDSPDPVIVDGDLTYTLTVTNNGPSPATGVIVTDTLPADVAFVSASGEGWTCNEVGGTVTCTRESLGVETAPVIAVSVTAPPDPGSIANSATVSSDTVDPDPANNTTSESTTVVPPTATTVTIGSGGVAPGEYITVPLEALSVVDLASVEIEVQYDPSVLDLITCIADPDGILDIELCEEFNNDGVNPDAVRFTSISAVGVSGDIVLAEIIFEAVGQPEDSSALDVEVVTFDNASGNPIPHGVENGQIYVLLLGDVDCKGTANSTDALFILQYFVGLRIPHYVCPLPESPPDILYLSACDVNGDGKCNSTDALFILQCFVGISNPFCPEAASASKSIKDVPQHESVRAALDATVRVSSGVVVPGKSIMVPLEVLKVDNLASVEMEVRYDPSVLHFTACNADPDDAFDLALCEEFDRDGVRPDAVRFTAISTAGVSGDIVMAGIAFKAVGPLKDRGALDIEVLTFADVQGGSIGVKIQDR